MNNQVQVVYNNENGYISYLRGGLEISTILSSYDDIIKLIDFDKGQLTVLMRRKEEEIEEYVDFAHALSLIHLSKQKGSYFKDVHVSDMVLRKE